MIVTAYSKVWLGLDIRGDRLSPWIFVKNFVVTF